MADGAQCTACGPVTPVDRSCIGGEVAKTYTHANMSELDYISTASNVFGRMPMRPCVSSKLSGCVMLLLTSACGMVTVDDVIRTCEPTPRAAPNRTQLLLTHLARASCGCVGGWVWSWGGGCLFGVHGHMKLHRITSQTRRTFEGGFYAVLSAHVCKIMSHIIAR